MPAVSVFSPSGNAYIDGISSGSKWNARHFTFGFPDATSAYSASYGYGELSKNFAGMTADQQDLVRGVLAQYQSIADITFAETSGAAADLRYARTGATSTAWAYDPHASSEGGDVWINYALKQFDKVSLGGYANLTLLHETGHAMGLKHADEAEGAFGALPKDHDSIEFTVMSYASYVGAPQNSGYQNGTWDYAQTLMMDDIAAIQQMYGASFDRVGQDRVYKWDPTTGEMSINGQGQGAPGGNRIFMTVWTGGADATYDFSNYKTDLKVDLRPGEWSTVSQDQLARLDVKSDTVKLARGNIANAYLVTENGHDNLVAKAIGGTGADVIVGNKADNSLTGGAGNDTLDGGEGVDTAIYAGRSLDYSLVKLASGDVALTASGAAQLDGTDILKSIEFLQFADGRVAVDDFGKATALKVETPAAEKVADLPALPTAADVQPVAIEPAPATPDPVVQPVGAVDLVGFFSYLNYFGVH